MMHSAGAGAAAVVALAALAAPAEAAHVGVFGETNFFEAAAAHLALSHDVVSGRRIADDLSGFDSVFVFGLSEVSETALARLTAFVAAGGGLYINGERPCCEARNAQIQRLADAALGTGAATIGGLGEFGSSARLQRYAIGDLDAGLSAVSLTAAGGIAGVSGRNVVAATDAGVVIAGWDEADMVAGAGRLVIAMDVNYTMSVTAQVAALLDADAAFLSAAGAAGPADPPTPAAEVPAPGAGALALGSLGLMAARGARRRPAGRGSMAAAPG